MKETLKMALEALQYGKPNKAITILRETLEREHAMHDLARLGQEIEQEPQAEPCIGKDPRCPCQDGDACHYKDCGDTKALPVPVAQPAQEPVAMYEDWYNTKSCGHCGMVGGHAKSCRHYTIPQKETEK